MGAPDQRSVMTECAIDLCGLTRPILELSYLYSSYRRRKNEFAVKD